MKNGKNLCLTGILIVVAALPACSSPSSDPTSGIRSAATGSPIKLGFLNQGSGPLAFPDFAAGGVAAVKKINATGGINGHVIELVTCSTDGSLAASVRCADQFVGDHVAAVVEGIDLSSDSTLPMLTYAGIPLIGHAQFGIDQTNSPDTFFFGAALGAYYGVPLATLAQKYDARRIAFLNIDSTATRAIADANLDPVATELGIDLEKVFYPPRGPNYNAVFASALTSKPDAVLIVASEADCTGLVQAGRALGYKGTIFAGSCGQFITADPLSAEGILTDSDVFLPDDADSLPRKAAEQVAIYREAMKAEPARNVNAFSQMTFSGMMDLAAAMRGIKGDITADSVKKSLASIRQVTSFTGQTVTCDGKQWPNAVSVCAPGLLIYEVEHGKRKLVSDGFVELALSTRADGHRARTQR
ncbi:ABC transporter substrate-binding protein [Streptomyces sp. NPDC051976]|uniref:ABC transporter substrate-binding protein n=1 Tax=Streptomyces sp. NPDC051976 TaxID=3154947 RepID=UPI003425D143